MNVSHLSTSKYKCVILQLGELKNESEELNNATWIEICTCHFLNQI